MSFRSTRWFLGIAVGGAMPLLGLPLGGIALSGNSAWAQQVVPDATLPQNSAVTRNGNNFTITDGTQRGGNLFHSFKEFSVPTGGTAFFNNATDIQNIFSRVTGGVISDIDGLIRANGRANLFLINPNGIVFGKNASLNVSGSFVGTTANAIQFGNIGSFSATNPEAPSPLLTINPSALLFNQIAAAPIQNNSSLTVPDGKSLLLVGGNISMDGGQLNAYGGRVELGGLAASGFVGLNVDGDKLSLDFPASSTRADISLTDGAGVFVQAGGGGQIAVNARNIDITKGSTLTAGIGGLGTLAAVAGDITLNATGEILVEGQGSNVQNNVQQGAVGNSGNINITTGTLKMTNGGQLQANTFGQGNAGNVTINARDTVSFEGTASNGDASAIVSIVTPNAFGNGGNISIKTGTLSLSDGGIVLANTLGHGSTGSVTINAGDRVSLDGQVSHGDASNVSNLVNPGGMGNSGGIRITTRTLSLKNGAELNTSTDGMGNAGDVIVEASDRVWFNQGSVITTVNQMRTGNGGKISITSGDVSLANGTQLITATSGIGNAGDVMILARARVSLNQGSVDTSVNETGRGKGGDISITSGDVSLANGSLLKSATNGQGNAGNAFLTTRSLSLTDGSLLTTVTDNSGSNAGAITIKATESVSLSGNNPDPMNRRSTEISSDTIGTATGSGGNITIDTSAFRVRDGAIINARTTSNGTGGSITINSKTFEALDGGELVTTTSGRANAGKITVNATDLVSVNGRDPTVNERRKIFNASGENLANVEEKSGFFVRSSGSGSTGDIEVKAPQIRLDNRGTLNAQSALGNGGNINLQSDLLLLRRGAQISTNAVTAEARGNGGNITIKTPNGFIVSVNNENSDISANAFRGSGGVIKINALGIYNFNQRSLSDLENSLKTKDPTKLDPQLLQTNDITAISLTSPALSGQVNVITPDIDPARGLVQLPTITENTPKLVATNCAAFADEGGSKFTVTGRGGLPPSPTEPLTNDVVWTDARLPATTTQHSSKKPSAKPHSKPEPIAIVPATGWVFNGKGQVTLISNASSNTSLRTTPSTCTGNK